MIENLSDVRVFLQVVDSGGLSSGARVLGMAPNTVSRTVARLERDVGVLLLSRTTRRINVTAEGRRFCEHARRLIDAARLAEACVEPPESGLTGRVRLAVRSTTVQFNFVPELTRLLEDHPRLRVQLVVTDEDVDPVAAGLDLALRVGPQVDSTLRRRRLGEVTFVLTASPAYLAARGRPRVPADLADHECIRSFGARPQSWWNLIGPTKKRVRAKVGGRFECNDVRSQSDAVYAGFGIGLRPLGEVRRATKTGSLVRVLPAWSLAPLSVYAILPPQRPKGGRARAVASLIDLLAVVVKTVG